MIRQLSVVEAYIPLYRKYRPQQFSDLVGQGVVSTAIQNALNLGKINHAYLFCGPRGTGKTSSARIFAKSLNCVNGPTVTPCHQCPSCVAITQGNALDVTEIDAASNNGVEHIRTLTDKVQFSAIEGRFKIYIIDEVHMLSTQAFNALLKTLEEPPPNVVFIFATTEPHKVLPTIISRCQRYDFSRITTAQIESRLKQVAQWEGIQISDEAVALIARHVQGGMRDALGLLDQVSVLGRSKDGYVIQPEDVRAFIGTLEEELLLELTQGIIGKAPQQILQQIGQLQERGVEPVQMVKELTHHFRNLLIAKTCGRQAPADLLDIPQVYYEKLWQQSQGLEAEEIPQMLSRLSTMEGQLRNSHQPQLWLEIGLLDLCYRHDIHLVQQLAERVAALEATLFNGQAPPSPVVRQQTAAAAPPPPRTPQPKAPAAEPVKTIVPPKAQPAPQQPAPQTPVADALPARAQAPVAQGTQDIGRLWQNIIDAIQHLPTQALVRDHFSLLEVSEKSVVIGFSKDTLYETFKRTPQKTAHLEQAVQLVLGQPYRLDFRLKLVAESRPVEAAVSAPVTARQPQPPQPQPEAPAEPVTTAAPEKPASQPEAPQPQAAVDVPQPVPPQPTARTEDDLAGDGVDFEMQQAKQYTQELLQGRLLD